MPSSVWSVSPVSSKLGLAPVSHTLNTGDLVLRISIHISYNTASRGWWFLGALLCVGSSVQNYRRHVKILHMSDELTSVTSQCAQHCFCWFWWGVFWHCHPRPGTVTGFRTKKQDNRPQHLNTSSMYTGLIKCPSITTWSVVLGFEHLHLLRDMANVNIWKPMLAP